jgi:hypothetical protein
MCRKRANASHQMSDDKEQRRAYWSAILALERKLLARLHEQQKAVDDKGGRPHLSAVEKHKSAIA